MRTYHVLVFLSVEIPYKVLLVSSCTSEVFKLELNTLDKYYTVQFA